MILLDANNITKSYVTKDVLTGASFNIQDNDKIGLVGNNGCGKTTLLKILIGEISRDGGDIYHKKDLSIGYLEQMTTLDLECSIYDECLKVFEETIKLEDEIRKMEKKISTMKDSDALDDLLLKYQTMQDSFNAMDGYEYHSRI